MKKMRTLALALTAIVMTSCGVLAPTATLTPVPAPITPYVPSSTPTSTLTPTTTPTATLVPTDTPTPTITPTLVDPWENFPGPSSESSTAIPRPIRTQLTPEESINILVLGTDDAPGRTSLNSDIMVLVSVNREKGTVTMVSFPRDLYVYLPGYKMNRINTAYAYGGKDLLALTMLYNFGIRVDYYAQVNLAGFVQAVNTLGGVDVTVEKGFTDYCGKQYSFTSGQTYHMDGHTALCYVRMRYASGGDLARGRKAQEVLVALLNKVLSIGGLTKVPELYVQYTKTVKTDMGLDTVLALAPIAARVANDLSSVRRYTLEGMVNPWRTPSGASVLLPDKEAVISLLSEALGN